MTAKIRPFDVVTTKRGNLALVTETDGTSASVDFIGPRRIPGDYCAWHPATDLTVLGNVMVIIANSMGHPMGRNTRQGTYFFGLPGEWERPR